MSGWHACSWDKRHHKMKNEKKMRIVKNENYIIKKLEKSLPYLKQDIEGSWSLLRATLIRDASMIR